MNNFNRNTVLVSAIHNTLDDIEIITKVMCHNDTMISAQLRNWQDGKLPDSYFKELLSVYLDELRKGE